MGLKMLRRSKKKLAAVSLFRYIPKREKENGGTVHINQERRKSKEERKERRHRGGREGRGRKELTASWNLWKGVGNLYLSFFGPLISNSFVFKKGKILFQEYRFFLGYSFPPHLRPDITGSNFKTLNFFYIIGPVMAKIF